MTNSKIIKGIQIDGIDVSGLTKEEACKILNEKVKERQQGTITLKYKRIHKRATTRAIRNKSRRRKKQSKKQ